MDAPGRGRDGASLAPAVVVGQLARDLVLVVDEVPAAGQSAVVRERREMLGGKGANQAVALAQLGLPVALVCVAGADETGERILAQASRDGIDTSAAIRREGASTGLVVDIVDSRGRWRYLEDLPPPVLLTPADVTAAAGLFAAADWVSLQLQQPPETALTAARLAREAGCRVVLDGAPADGDPAELLAAADVIRADAREARLLTGAVIGSEAAAAAAAARLLRHGPSLVALAAGDAGNLIAWPGGHEVVPLTDTPVADTTGADDAFTAALIASLARGYPPQRAGRTAVAAAGAAVGHPGGRPELTGSALRHQMSLLQQAR